MTFYLILYGMACHEQNISKIRDCVVNGIFYSDSKADLESELNGLFAKVETPEGSSCAIVSPHAGYNYSGIFSAAAFLSASKRSIKNAVVLAPVHRDPMEGAVLPESEFFATPLGKIKVNSTLINELASADTLLTRNDIPHLEEHCVEIQLPFIQYLFPDATITPILIGTLKEENVVRLSECLQSVLTGRFDETLFIVSSNLTTYRDFMEGKMEADFFLDLVMKKDIQSIIQAKNQGTITACGSLGVAAMLMFKAPVLEPVVLARGDSSSGNGDTKNGVHYAALSLCAGGYS